MTQTTHTVKSMNISLSGLSQMQVEQSRAKHGSNKLVQEKRKGFFSQFLQSFSDPIIKILLAALAINVILFFRHFDWFETIGICISIFLATFVSTISEYGSESAFRELEKESASITSRVKRNNTVISLPIGEVVVGDIIYLQSGERIPADGILISGSLRVDQSSLNGESKEAKKISTTDKLSMDKDLNSPSSLFSGTVVCSGEGVMRVINVGTSTLYGKLSLDIQSETQDSPLRVRLANLAGTLSKIGYMAALLVAIADLANAFLLDNAMNWPIILSQLHDPKLVIARLLHALTLAITTVVVAVPEGLPMMITIVLSSNMKRMLKDHVLVRKLVGIETSGSLNILFTDKTGTLTNGKLQVSKFISGDGTEYKGKKDFNRKDELWKIVELSCVKNNESIISKKSAIGGNGTDRALMEFAMPVSKEVSTLAVHNRIPFDSKNKFSCVSLERNKNIVFIKGAPEKVLFACTSYYDKNGNVIPLRNLSILRNKLNMLTQDAMRVIALAVSPEPVSGGVFSNLTLVGLVGIRDDVRPDVKSAVNEVLKSGIQVVMVTGDNKNTAVAIARNCGLVYNDISDSVITSDELSMLSDDMLKRRLPTIRVVARALPGDKSRLVKVAQSMGLVVGMTGDGVNDSPALKLADVGFAMGSGTEVAKSASDIVIINNSFTSIEKAILYGRTIFKSIRKFIIFQLTMNLCAVGVSIIGPFIGIDTPITVVQMLWINIIMDTLAGLAFAGEPPLKEYMRERPKKRNEAIINKYMLTQLFFTGCYTLLLCIAFLKLPFFHQLFKSNVNELYFMTCFFAVFIYSGIFNSFNAHTHRLNLIKNLRRNPGFVVIMLVVCVVQFLMIYFGGAVFRTTAISIHDFVLVLIISCTVIPVDIVRKIILRKLHKYNHV